MTRQNAKPEQYLLEMHAELPRIHFQMVNTNTALFLSGFNLTPPSVYMPYLLDRAWLGTLLSPQILI